MRQTPLPTPALDRAVGALNETAALLGTALRDCHVDSAGGVGAGGVGAGAAGGVGERASVELVPAVLAWMGGASFERAWLLSPSTFEGTLVRCMQQLDEMLRQMGEAAAALGDTALRERLGECSKGLHRGIAFSGSLYAV